MSTVELTKAAVSFSDLQDAAAGAGGELSGEDCSYEDSYVDDIMYDCCHDDLIDYNEEDSTDENNIYLNDPEQFEYDCYSLERIDWIMERKCERLIEALRLQEPVDALLLLKKFKWNVERVIEIYEEDRQAFWQTYFSDNNNNNDVKATSEDCNR